VEKKTLSRPQTGFRAKKQRPSCRTLGATIGECKAKKKSTKKDFAPPLFPPGALQNIDSRNNTAQRCPELISPQEETAVVHFKDFSS
jgi:hypothetical protein